MFYSIAHGVKKKAQRYVRKNGTQCSLQIIGLIALAYLHRNLYSAAPAYCRYYFRSAAK